MRLYKYCPWNGNKHIQDNLKNSVLYFQKPELLNDPFDVFPAANNHGLNKFSAERIQSLRNSIGVCCFTTDSKNILMWAHYADRHRGICLSFNFPDNKSIINPPELHKTNTFVIPERVTYAQTRPKINLIDENSLFTNFFLIKYAAWNYEKEYRAFVKDDFGEFTYNPKYLTGIIAGCKIPDEDLSALRQLINKLPSQVTLFKTIPEPNAFRLDIIRI